MFLELKKVSRSNQRKGFTLVELLIVAVIVAIIAAIAVPAYLGFIQRARETAVISFLVELHKGQEAYRLNNPEEKYTMDFYELEKTGFISGSGLTQVGSTTTGKGQEKGKGKGKGLEKTESTTTSNREQHKYMFDLTTSSDAAGNSTWNVYAYPKDGNKKVRWFYEDQTGIIRYEIGKNPKPDSPPI